MLPTMPTLRVLGPTGAPQLYYIHKPVTTIGRALDNDVAIAATTVAKHHVQVVFVGRDFVLEEVERDADIAINGKRKRRARLVHGDRLTIGATEIVFSMFLENLVASRADGTPPSDTSASKHVSSELAGVRRLFSFSEKLLNRIHLDELLEAMLDDVIELTLADKGLLIMVQGAAAASGYVGSGQQKRRFTVRASRNVRRETVADAEGQISDSIVREVIERARAIVVSDALADTQFGSSESVIAMKLSS